MEPLKVKEKAEKLLLKTVTLLEEKGWIQHNSETSSGYCMWGALVTVHNENYKHEDQFARRPIYASAIAAISKAINTNGIVKWNDAGGRTKEEVINALKEASTLVQV